MRLPDGTPGVGVAVELQARSATGWTTVATSVTDAGGAWSAVVTLPYTRSLRARATVDPSGTPLVSPRVRLEVRSAVSARIGPRRLRAGRRAVVKGTIEPRQRARRRIVTLERRAAGGRYLRVARFPAVARDGRFRIPLSLSRPGLFRVRISMRSDRLNAPSRSPYLFARALR